MVTYFASSAAMGRAIQCCLPAGAARPVNDWSALRHDGLGADAVIIGVPTLVDSRVRNELRTARAYLSLQPIVLVTTFGRENASLLMGVEVDEVIWLDQVQEELPRAVARALLSAPPRRLAAAVARSHLSLPLRRTIAEALVKWPVPRTVLELAALGHISISRLEEIWRIDICSNREFSPKRFLDLLIALRAAALIRLNKPIVVALRLGVDLRTLERVLRRTGGWTPSSLRTVPTAEIAQRLRTSLLPPAPR